MSNVRRFGTLGLLALTTLSLQWKADADEIKTVFVIALENHNWTQPASQTSPQPIFQNPTAPFINSLVNGTAFATVNGRPVNISRQVAYATNYLNVLSTPSGNNPHVHPSEPNYLWAEAGNNFLVSNDNDPYSPNGGPTNQVNNQDGVLHLTTLLTLAGRTWRSYQEDIDLTPGAGQPTNTAGSQLNNVVLPRSQWTVPLDELLRNLCLGRQSVQRLEPIQLFCEA
jgi:phosphatidylinositol-3-phosphatase